MVKIMEKETQRVMPSEEMSDKMDREIINRRNL